MGYSSDGGGNVCGDGGGDDDGGGESGDVEVCCKSGSIDLAYLLAIYVFFLGKLFFV